MTWYVATVEALNGGYHWRAPIVKTPTNVDHLSSAFAPMPLALCSPAAECLVETTCLRFNVGIVLQSLFKVLDATERHDRLTASKLRTKSGITSQCHVHGRLLCGDGGYPWLDYQRCSEKCVLTISAVLKHARSRLCGT